MISVEDELYGTADIARVVTPLIPIAEIRILPEGGHVAIGSYGRMLARTGDFLRRAD